MPERYSISSRKEDKTKQKSSASSKSKLYNGGTGTSTLVWVGVAVGAVLATNIATVLITVVVYTGQINSLNKQIKDLQSQLDNYKKAFGDTINPQKTAQTNKKTAPATGIPVSANVKAGVQTALNTYTASGGANSGALQSGFGPLLAPTVTVIIAGSSSSQQSAQQALDTLNYLKGANGTWNWNLSPEQLAQYQSGPYAQYFGDNTVVGQSSNGYVVSFTVNSSGQITQIFISPTTQDATSNGQITE